MHIRTQAFAPLIMIACSLLVASGASEATTKGLNQIPTPDVQPFGVLSLSYQEVHPRIDNAMQFQTEYGITRRFELATIHGFSPREDRLGGELSLVQNGPYLLSVGFLNWTTKGGSPQGFIEAGYYKGKDQWMIGALQNNSKVQGIAGFLHKFNSRLWFSADYQTGRSNFGTIGLTFNLTRNLIFNPAIYITNDHRHSTLGYSIVTWNIKLR